jgi:hypothetical protein
MDRASWLVYLILPLFVACDSDVKIGTFNTPPAAAITSHADGDEVFAGAEVLLTGNVSDADGASESLTVTWIIGGLHTCTDAVADETGLTSCAAVIEEGKGDVSLQVQDPGNEVGQANITLVVIPNEAPVALILSPTDSGTFYSDQPITFEGSASDAEDAAEDLIINWNSDLDGDLALQATPDSTGSFTGNGPLSQGTHLISLTATDTVSKTGTDTVTISVGPPNTEPSCEITAPVSGSAGEEGALIQFEGLVSDPDIANSLLTVEWSSDKDGVIGGSNPNSSGDVAFLYDALTAEAHVITMTVTDEVGVPCSDFITYTVGTAPTITLTAPSTGDSFKLGEYISFSAEVSDSEDSPTALTLGWTSSLDGSFSSQGADSTGVAQFQDNGLAEGTHALTVTVTDSTGLFATAIANFEVVANSAPSIAGVSISPDPAYKPDTLTCSPTGYTDADGDPDLSTYQWSIGGIVVGTSSTLSGSFVKGDTVQCTITPFDGSDSGTPVSATRTISNSAPSVASVSISPSGPIAGDTLTCGYSGFSDADGDSDASTYEWFVDGVTSGTGSTLSSGFSGGDSVSCTVTPFDGSDSGTPVSSASVTVGNSAPSITSVSISPDPAYVTDALDCSYSGFSDADGDADASTYKWLINGSNAGSGNSLTSGFVKGDTVKCKVTPSDGTDTGSVVTASLVISNTAPVASGVSIAPSAPTVSDTLDCSYAFFDADGDADATTIEWTDASGTALGTGASLSGAFSNGDTITCTVTPTDDEESGSPESASVTIGNSAPSVTDVSISPASPLDNDTLTCSWIFADDDGDADASTVEWTDGSGTSLGSGATLSSGFATGDDITCTVTADDGSDTGNSASDTVTIGASNTAPSVSNVTVQATTDADGDANSATAIAADELECSWTFSDPQGDSDNSTVEWFNGSGSSLGTGTTLSGAYAKGDTVTCTVTPNDGTVDGSPDSGSIVIGNTAPTVTGVTVLSTTDADGDGYNTTAIAADTLECTWTFDDGDGGSDNSTVEWSDGTSVLGTGTTLSGAFVGGDTITCTVTPNDGTVDGTPDSGSIVIGNTAPTVTGVTVLATTDADGDMNDATAIAADTLECTWTYDDVDGGSDNSTVEWSDGSSVLGTGTTLSGAFVGGDTITCTVTPNDGTVDGTPDSGSIVIGNTAPTVTGVTVLSTTDADGDGYNTTAIAADTLECTWTYDDVDGGSDTSSVEWTDGSSVLGTGTTLSGAFVGGDTITCTVTPNDGTVDGTPDSGSIVIRNTAPTVTGVTVLSTTDADGDGYNTTAIAADTLECTWTYDDVDGGSDNSTVEWSDGSSVLGTGTTLSGAFVDGDTITCTVTPNDGTVDGTPDSGSIVIGNTVPTQPTVQITPTAPVEGDELLCSVTVDSTDADGDSVDYSFVWTYDDGLGSTGTASGAMLATTVYTDDTVLAGETVVDETWTCTVTPNDGTDDGVAGVDSVLVESRCWSLDFDGVGDYVSNSTFQFSNGGTNFTVSLWAKLGANMLASPSNPTHGGLIGQWNDPINDGWQFYFRKYYSQVGLAFINGGDIYDVGWNPQSGQWYQLVIVKDGTSKTIYIDGQKILSSTNGGQTVSSTYQLELGRIPNDGDYSGTFEGILSNIQIWESSFSDAQVLDLYASGQAPISFTTVLSYQDGTGSTAVDSSGNGHDGTLNGATWVNDCPEQDADADGYPTWQDCDDNDPSVHDPDGSTENCAGIDCWSLLEAGYAIGDGTDDGIYWIDPQSDGTAFEAYCVMDVSYDGGGWTLSAVSSDDGQDTWTWNDRNLWDTDTTTFGSLSSLEYDFKSPALHEVAMADMLFMHEPSGEWAGYNGVSDGSGDFGALVNDTGGPNCYNTGDGYALTAGTISVSGSLCDSSLYISPLDRDGGNCISMPSGTAAYGPTWNAYSNQSCPFDDPGGSGSLGSSSGSTSSIEVAALGFGWALGLNTGTIGAAENYMWVLVRDRDIPLGSSSGTGYIAISASEYFTCALDAFGIVECWGKDDYGQISNLPPGGYTNLGTGDYHGCVQDISGNIQCWGWDPHSNVIYDTPSGSFTAMTAGARHSCALNASGGIHCWGMDTQDQVSDAPTDTGYTAVSAGGSHSCALDATGKLTCWGWNFYDQIGDAPSGTGYIALSAGGYHTCVLDPSGNIECGGRNVHGQSAPVPPGPGYTAVSAGDWHSCALDATGSIECWGLDSFGQVSNAPSGEGYIAVSAGSAHSCARDAEGRIECWGIDDHGQSTPP